MTVDKNLDEYLTPEEEKAIDEWILQYDHYMYLKNHTWKFELGEEESI